MGDQGTDTTDTTVTDDLLASLQEEEQPVPPTTPEPCSKVVYNVEHVTSKGQKISLGVRPFRLTKADTGYEIQKADMQKVLEPLIVKYSAIAVVVLLDSAESIGASFQSKLQNFKESSGLQFFVTVVWTNDKKWIVLLYDRVFLNEEEKLPTTKVYQEGEGALVIFDSNGIAEESGIQKYMEQSTHKGVKDAFKVMLLTLQPMFVFFNAYKHQEMENTDGIHVLFFMEMCLSLRNPDIMVSYIAGQFYFTKQVFKQLYKIYFSNFDDDTPEQQQIPNINKNPHVLTNTRFFKVWEYPDYSSGVRMFPSVYEAKYYWNMIDKRMPELFGESEKTDDMRNWFHTLRDFRRPLAEEEIRELIHLVNLDQSPELQIPFPSRDMRTFTLEEGDRILTYDAKDLYLFLKEQKERQDAHPESKRKSSKVVVEMNETPVSEDPMVSFIFSPQGFILNKDTVNAIMELLDPKNRQKRRRVEEENRIPIHADFLEGITLRPIPWENANVLALNDIYLGVQIALEYFGFRTNRYGFVSWLHPDVIPLGSTDKVDFPKQDAQYLHASMRVFLVSKDNNPWLVIHDREEDLVEIYDPTGKEIQWEDMVSVLSICSCGDIGTLQYVQNYNNHLRDVPDNPQLHHYLGAFVIVLQIRLWRRSMFPLYDKGNQVVFPRVFLEQIANLHSDSVSDRIEKVLNPRTINGVRIQEGRDVLRVLNNMQKNENLSVYYAASGLFTRLKIVKVGNDPANPTFSFEQQRIAWDNVGLDASKIGLEENLSLKDLLHKIDKSIIALYRSNPHESMRWVDKNRLYPNFIFATMSSDKSDPLLSGKVPNILKRKHHDDHEMPVFQENVGTQVMEVKKELLSLSNDPDWMRTFDKIYEYENLVHVMNNPVLEDAIISLRLKDFQRPPQKNPSLASAATTMPIWKGFFFQVTQGEEIFIIRQKTIMIYMNSKNNNNLIYYNQQLETYMLNIGTAMVKEVEKKYGYATHIPHVHYRIGDRKKRYVVDIKDYLQDVLYLEDMWESIEIRWKTLRHTNMKMFIQYTSKPVTISANPLMVVQMIYAVVMIRSMNEEQKMEFEFGMDSLREFLREIFTITKVRVPFWR